MSAVAHSPPQLIGPAWEIARLFPEQGSWNEQDYLAITRNSRCLVELSDGYIEVLSIPTAPHQNIVVYLLMMLRTFVLPRKIGYVLPAPFRIRLGENKFREPDISFMSREHANRMSNEFWDGADLVVEVMSDDPKDRERDSEIKRREYAQGGIPEYWMIDPLDQRITVFKLSGREYVVHAERTLSGKVGSALLPGFELDVAAVFASSTFESL